MPVKADTSTVGTWITGATPAAVQNLLRALPPNKHRDNRRVAHTEYDLNIRPGTRNMLVEAGTALLSLLECHQTGIKRSHKLKLIIVNLSEMFTSTCILTMTNLGTIARSVDLLSAKC